MTRDQEPRLKYNVLGADVELILSRQEASAFCASDKLRVVGCCNGGVYVVDFEGHKICELPAQSSAITALTLNGSLDHVACGTAGGMVHVWEVYSGKEVLRADAPTSVTCLALSPSTKGPVKEVVVGTARGELLVCRKGFFGASDTKIVTNIGRTHSTVWLPSGLVWASDYGCRGCAMPSSYSPSPPILPPPAAGSLLSCSLTWVSATIVIAAWPHALQLLSARATTTRSSATAMVASSTLTLTELAAFSVPYRLLGAVPFGAHVAVLADCREVACRPDVHVSRLGGETEAPVLRGTTEVLANCREVACRPDVHVSGLGGETEAPVLQGTTEVLADCREAAYRPDMHGVGAILPGTTQGSGILADLYADRSPGGGQGDDVEAQGGVDRGPGSLSAKHCVTEDVREGLTVGHVPADEEGAAKPQLRTGIAEISGDRRDASATEGLAMEGAAEAADPKTPQVIQTPRGTGNGEGVSSGETKASSGGNTGAAAGEEEELIAARNGAAMVDQHREEGRDCATSSKVASESAFEFAEHLQLRILSLEGAELSHHSLDAVYSGPQHAHLLACWYPERYGNLLAIPEPSPPPPSPAVKNSQSLPAPSPATPAKHHRPQHTAVPGSAGSERFVTLPAPAKAHSAAAGRETSASGGPVASSTAFPDSGASSKSRPAAPAVAPFRENGGVVAEGSSMGLPSCTPCKAEVEIEPPRLEREGSADVPGDSEARVDTSGKELQIDSGTSREHHASDASIHGDKPKPAADLTEKALRSEADVSGNKDLEPKDDVPKLFRQGSNVAVAARGPGLLRHSSSTLELPEEKWWFDNDDPLYFVVTPGSITLGRPCDTDDQVLWLLGRKRFRQAMDVTMAGLYVRPETRAACSAAFLDHLLATEQYTEAAAWAPRLLGSDRHAWERIVFAFGQNGHLPLLAHRIPTDKPRLSRTTYLMAIASFLPQPDKHGQLLDLLRSWPHEVLSGISEVAIDSIQSHLSQRPEQPFLDLQRCLALLHQLLGHHELVLDISLRVSDPSMFAYIRKFHLYNVAAHSAVRLMNIDEDEAVRLFVACPEAAPVPLVVADLQQEEKLAAEAGRADAVHVCRRRLFKYLHGLFMRERRASHNHHDLQIELYASFAPHYLLPFLQSSKQFHMDAALDVATRHNLVAEQVFILGRMSRASEALKLIVSKLQDLPRAIAFVSSQDDDKLWDELIDLVTSDPKKASDLTGQLLDQIGGHIDPLRLMRAIPDNLVIPRLRIRLSSLIKRFRSSVLLKQRCNDIIEADCMLVAAKLLRASLQPLRQVYVQGDGGSWQLYDAVTGVMEACEAPDIPRQAVAFSAPSHTLAATPQEHVAVHLQHRLDTAEAKGCNGVSCGAGVDGWRALATAQSQQAAKDAEAELLKRPRQTTRIWHP